MNLFTFIIHVEFNTLLYSSSLNLNQILILKLDKLLIFQLMAGNTHVFNEINTFQNYIYDSFYNFYAFLLIDNFCLTFLFLAFV